MHSHITPTPTVCCLSIHALHTIIVNRVVTVIASSFVANKLHHVAAVRSGIHVLRGIGVGHNHHPTQQPEVKSLKLNWCRGLFQRHVD